VATHVGIQRRVITVGGSDVLVAGTGGVLVDEQSRGTGLGGGAMRHAQQAIRDEARVDFGFLGCRQEVVPFYESAGWIQVHATERSLSRLDQTSVIVSDGWPDLACSAMCDASGRPQGDMDLRGTRW
jgi:aminoglycoside 2'-N-acetyltransferase I